jgi:hypothetical protein
MSTYTVTQAYAICDMGRGVPEYNEGVMSMLGKGELARTYKARMAECDELADARDALAGDGFGFLLDPNPEQRIAQDRLTAAAKLASQAWTPIQAIIDEARVIVDAHEFKTQW